MRERRDFRRISESIEGRCRVSGHLGVMGQPITIVNFSASGLRFRGQEQLEKGALLEIEAKLPGMKDVLLLKARAVWSTLHASGVVETGVEFYEVSPERQFQIDNLVAFFKNR